MKKTKKVAMVLMIMFMCILSAIIASASEEIEVVVDGNPIEFDVSPTIIDGRTMVPIRAIFESLGATVEWDKTTQTAISTKGDKTILLSIDKANMYVNGQEYVLDVPAKLLNGRTLVPIRAVSEAFNCQVGWDGNSRTISIITDTSNFQMLYALEERSRSFRKNEVEEQLKVGWYTEPVQVLYAVGKSEVFPKSIVDEQLKVGWYLYPVTKVYASGGRSEIIPTNDLNAWLSVGWSTTIVSEYQLTTNDIYATAAAVLHNAYETAILPATVRVERAFYLPASYGRMKVTVVYSLESRIGARNSCTGIGNVYSNEESNAGLVPQGRITMPVYHIGEKFYVHCFNKDGNAYRNQSTEISLDINRILDAHRQMFE